MRIKMKKLLFLIMILTLSSCVVSSKLYDEKCLELEASEQQRINDRAAFDLKDEICRTKCSNLLKEMELLKSKNDTIK